MATPFSATHPLRIHADRSIYVPSLCSHSEASAEQTKMLREAYARSRAHNKARNVSTAEAIIEIGEDFDSSREETKAFTSQRLRQPFIVLIDGVIFLDQPKGIYSVWKNLIPELAKHFPAPSRFILLDRLPGARISKFLGAQPHVERVTVPSDGELDSTIRDVVMRGYRYTVDRATDEIDNSAVTVDEHKPIVVFISTYYSYPELAGICNVIMFHDLVPEKVGLDMMPGTQFYPRVINIGRTDSIVSVSHATSRDIVELYGDRVTKRHGDAFFDARPPRHVGDYLHNTIVSTTVNRVSRALFPGPADMRTMMEFRKRYRIWAAERPAFLRAGIVPADYFALVGSSWCYKNHPSVFAAFDHLPDNWLERVSLLVVGNGAPGSFELGGISRHRVVVTEEVDGELRETVYSPFFSTSDVPIRIRVVPYMKQEDLPTMYSASIAVLYLSAYEGFGLPLAEAMTSGTLGVATNSSSLPEVGGPSTITTYVNDPTDPIAIASGMMQMLNMSREERELRVQRALKWVERYGGGGRGGIGRGWEEMAREIAAHIRGRKHRGRQCYRSPWDRAE